MFMAKIAIIINSITTFGGEERVVSLMANEFAKEHDVTIISSETRRFENGPKNNYYLSDDIKVVIADLKKDNIIDKCIRLFYQYIGFPKAEIFQKILMNVFYSKEYLDEWVQRINDGNYDIVIAITGANTMLLGLIRDRINCKCMSWEHSSYEGYFGKPLGAFKNREKLFSECAKKLDKVVVLNKDIAQKYKDNLGIDTVIVPNPKSFSSEKKANVTNKSIVACGRLEVEKGYDDLIQAFAEFHDSHPEWKLTIIGGGRLEESLRKLINVLGMENAISITGYTSKVTEELLKGSIFAMTSRWEGFPMTVTEALEVGLPVVAYGIPAMEPLVTNEVEGIIVPAFERDAFVNALLTLANDVDMKRKMSEAAIEKAKTLTPENVYKIWQSLFKELLTK